MKKLAIAGASVALAAMPIVGVFAADYNPIVDTVEVTINDSCHMQTNGTTDPASTDGGVYKATVNAGTLVGDTGTAWGTGANGVNTVKTITFSCNKQGGWKVTAQGVESTSSTTGRTTMNGLNGKTIETGTATEGTTSNWAMKLTGTGVSIINDYDDWHAVPGTAAIVAQSTNSAPVSNATITPAYRVWVSATQEADTYTGYVRYVLTAPLSGN